jgi:hypothetical protein
MALVIAPVAGADPGQNGPPGPEGNPNQPPAAPAPAPPAAPPGNSGANPHGGPPGIAGSAPPAQTPPPAPSQAASSSHPAPPAAAADQSNPAPAGSGEPQGPPAQVPPATGLDGDPGTGGDNPGGGPDGWITICHATGSETNPFVEITISVNGLHGHGGHQDGADIIPAPAGGCGAATPIAPSVAQQFGDVGSASRDGAGSASRDGTGTGSRTGIGPGPAFASGDAGGAVLAESASGQAAPGGETTAGPGAPGAGGTADAPGDGQLPFTGMFLGGLALCGLVALGGGLVLRRVARMSASSL